MKIILKSLEFFEKASHNFKKASIPCLEILKKPHNFYKSLTLIIKSLHFSENVLKKPQHRVKFLTLLQKAFISL
jgi:hypothetical protein